MRNEMKHLSRRSFVMLTGITIAGGSLVNIGNAEGESQTIPLFDGKTLNGWIQIENNATSLSPGQITDQTAFVGKLMNGPSAVTAFLRGQLEDSVKQGMATYSASNIDAKGVISAIVKSLNQIISGPSIYDRARFGNIVLRPETRELLKQGPHGQRLARLNKLLIEDAYPELTKTSSTGWEARDGVMASLGTGRGVIYTAKDYNRYRLTFTMRHVSGKPNHQACVLIFCTRPGPEENPLDALGGIQFQVPNGGHWDYRPGRNDAGGAEFTTVTKTQFDVHAWSRVEILVDGVNGTARMTVAQPPGNSAVEVLFFRDAAAGKSGPIAFQMHNAGLFDEYKDVAIEVDSKDNNLSAVG
jgi:3-keto-disaccharide hydrolase